MLKRISFLSGALSLMLLLPATAQKLVEKVEKKGDEIVIPYEKYKLDNGMTIIIHVDKSDPIVHTDVTYHVGSAREQIGRSGFAHFFEHMMFQGSDNVADEEHFAIVTEAGGTMNGTTNLDRTNYFETLPSNQLETSLWLEADRMGFLLDAVTQQKFEIQRATVKNERGQNYDNRPYGLVGERTNEALYPYGHPYSWPTIGYLKDLDRVTVDDLKRFFLRWYGPNNAVLTVAGNVDPAEVVRLAQKYFGSIPRGPEVKPMDKMPVTLDKDRYISMEDNIRFPMIQMTWPAVYSGSDDELPLDLLAELIGGDKTSILYQNLIKTNLAVQARAYNPAAELAGTFVVNVLPFPGKTLADMEKIIRDAFVEFEKRGVKDEDLIRIKNSREAQMIQNLESVSGKASKLAYNETFKGNPNYIKKEIDQLQKLTKADVIRVYEKYIKGKPAVITSVVPKGQKELIAHEDNFTPKRATEAESAEGSEYKNLSYVKAKDVFDRSKHPAPGANPVIRLPEFWKETSANGLQIIGTQDNDLPIVSMLISFPAGHAAENPAKAGLSNLLTDVMSESTLKYSSEEITSELEKLGSEISISSDREYVYVNVFSLKKNLARTIELLEEKLFHPKFDEEEFNTAKAQEIAAIDNNATRAATIADNVYSKLLYGDHIFGIPVIGTKASLEGITLQDVKDFYAAQIIPAKAKLVAVGQITSKELNTAVPFLLNWKTSATPAEIKQPATPAIAATTIYFVNKDKAPQSEIRIGYMALPFDADGEYYRAGVMNYTLGGNFNSRINLMLREKKGYTYGARSGFSGTLYRGSFTASAGVKAEKTDSSLMDFFSEMNAFRASGITPEELNFTKNSLGQRDALKYETPFQKALFLQNLLVYNLDKNYIDKQSAILGSLTKNDIDGLAKRYLPTDKMIVVVVGDKASNWDKIKALGYPVVELDTEGNIVK
jgi:zinc protease